MSRGLGTAQLRVLETIFGYHKLGGAVQWEWRVGGSHARRLLEPDRDESDRQAIEAYSHGQMVELCMLRRDTSLPAPELSRALRSLWQRGLVFLYDAGLDALGDSLGWGSNAKFAGLSLEGRAKCQERQSAKVGT